MASKQMIEIGGQPSDDAINQSLVRRIARHIPHLWRRRLAQDESCSIRRNRRKDFRWSDATRLSDASRRRV